MNAHVKWLVLLFTLLLWNIHMRGQYPNWDSIKVFKRMRLCLKFDSFARTDSLLSAFLLKEDTCSLKFRFLSISKPNNSCLLLSQIFSFPILPPKFSFLYPKTSKLHLSWFYFMLSFSNHSIGRKLSSSNLFIKEFKYISQAWNVVSSAKLHKSVNSGRKNKSFKQILNRRGPTDPWETPWLNSFH